MTGLPWGVPGADAAVAARLAGNAARAAVFGYEAGDTLADGSTTPARRVGFYVGPAAGATPGAAEVWNANGRALFAAAVDWALSGPAPAAVLRILPLGDSITRGTGGFWSYRRDFAALLDADSCRYTMTGTEFGPPSGAPGAGDFDRDHEGHGGFRTDQILAALPAWLPGNTPDWVLLHLGTNDVLQGTSLAYQDTALRTTASGGRDRHRRCKAKRTRTRDDEHRHSRHDCKCQAGGWPQYQP